MEFFGKAAASENRNRLFDDSCKLIDLTREVSEGRCLERHEVHGSKVLVLSQSVHASNENLTQVLDLENERLELWD